MPLTSRQSEALAAAFLKAKDEDGQRDILAHPEKVIGRTAPDPEEEIYDTRLSGYGDEGAYAAIRVNGKPVGAPDRSLSYKSNAWEYPVPRAESNYTYYIPLTPDMIGAKIDAVVLVLKNGVSEFKPEVWVTAYPVPFEKIEIR